MTRPFSLAFKKEMVTRMVGADAMSARRLAARTGVSQEALSRWLRDARNLSGMESTPPGRRLTLDDKVRILAAARELEGEALLACLATEGVTLGDLEEWRLALEQDGTAARATTRRIRNLERELARKDKALAEAAALLVLQKKAQALFSVDEDDDPDGKTET
jgi:transposase-like protein